MIYVDLILNLALLVALSIVSGFLEQRWSRRTTLGMVLQGLLFGGAATLAMLKPFVYQEGLIFDGRSVMISLGGFFFGPLTALISIVPTSTLRIITGGSGAVMGVSVILSSALIGVVANYILRPYSRTPSVRELYFFGLAVHVVMVLLMFTLPPELIRKSLTEVAPAVLLLYPLATILVGKVLSDQVDRSRIMSELEKTKEGLSAALYSIDDAVFSVDLQGRIVLMNPAAESLTGWDFSEARGKAIGEVVERMDRATLTSTPSPVDEAMEPETVLAPLRPSW
ncbi:MAG: hypothetical protein Kow00107_09320 [Planctomycetota bacterium]